MTSSSSEKRSSNHEGSSDGAKIVVDIKGNVKSPGIYTMRVGMRISQAIDSAGGFLSSADQKQINLAQKVTDEMIIYVPAKGEIKSSPAVMNAGQSSSGVNTESTSNSNEKSNGGQTVNLNTATKEQLQELTGIGPKKAEQILQYREEHQSFKTTDEIKEVGGIGDKTFESLKDSLSV
ncbi:helix-hairpin-helix domain-containing protein [Dellaglioa algida]|uniref:Competence protein ComEA n=2 Tax=Dellaglioa algida TaxID=105612 RepID=A0A0R1HJ27_9LACO|nr:helix-hairpin-helix domain-containing protein [Dellaglioa algida]KRK46335.1 competence protein ComEA [Dellaglioa algida DSM 15638]MDK1726204.1 helix-hairpin-helix domain-containing protein [Dellaglioa algida]MDK1727709.1 helix-hairpin-helix domain-containing protein [Dellaglioa algida]MDK1732347.1 helix-hairpin-helix domain-containing protein [Dellaglioa algida]MDK1733873.1 helix-hairpin-helix domain-containing protein [Dellaglioa algida]